MFYRKGMFSHVNLFKLPENYNEEKFKHWMISEHAKLAKKLPGLKWYNVLFSLADSPFSPPAWDGYEQFWFENRQALEAAYNSSEMKDVMQNFESSDLNKPGVIESYWAREYIIDIPLRPESLKDDFIKEPGLYRHMGTIKCSKDKSKEKLEEWWITTHAEIARNMPGLRWYTILMTLDDTPLGPPPFDGNGDVWFESHDALKTAFASDAMKKGRQDVVDNAFGDLKTWRSLWVKEEIINI